MQDWLSKLDGFFSDLFLKKVPQLSEKTRVTIVSFVPWITLIVGVMAVPAVLMILGLGAIITPLSLIGGRKITSLSIGSLLITVKTIMRLVSVPSLFKRSKSGWNLLYWATLVGILENIIMLSGSGLAAEAISLYFLYQIKSAYS